MPHITSGVLAVLLFLSTYFFISSYHQYEENQQNIETQKVRGRIMQQQINEMKQKRKAVLQVNSFVESAVALGLEEKNWSFYKVNIQEPVTFEELGNILSQCSNSSTHYFHPITFHVKTIKKTDSELTKKNKTTASSAPIEKDTGDLMVTLNGEFIVRH